LKSCFSLIVLNPKREAQRFLRVPVASASTTITVQFTLGNILILEKFTLLLWKALPVIGGMATWVKFLTILQGVAWSSAARRERPVL
jgi:hypothetical protein